jgi:hypothetical protein
LVHLDNLPPRKPIFDIFPDNPSEFFAIVLEELIPYFVGYMGLKWGFGLDEITHAT